MNRTVPRPMGRQLLGVRLAGSGHLGEHTYAVGSVATARPVLPYKAGLLSRDVVFQLLDGRFLLRDDPLPQVADRAKGHHSFVVHDWQMGAAGALARKAGRDGHLVFYSRAAALFRDLALARADGSLRNLRARLSRVDVLVWMTGRWHRSRKPSGATSGRSVRNAVKPARPCGFR